MNRTLSCYDHVASLYDLTRDYPYGPMRRLAVEKLNLSPGETVTDFFCGTGVNFELLAARLGSGGQIIGLDGLRGMLEKAQQRKVAVLDELIQVDFTKREGVRREC